VSYRCSEPVIQRNTTEMRWYYI